MLGTEAAAQTRGEIVHARRQRFDRLRAKFVDALPGRRQYVEMQVAVADVAIDRQSMRRDRSERRLGTRHELRDAANPHTHVVLHGPAVALLRLRHALAQQPQRTALPERIGDRAVEDLAAREPVREHPLELRPQVGVVVRGRKFQQ